MASALKRKRGPGEVEDTPKRARSVKGTGNPPSTSLIPQRGWESAFKPPPKTKQLITTIGTNGEGLESKERSESVEAVDYEVFKETIATQEKENRKRELAEEKEKRKENKKLLKKVLAMKDRSAWKLSEPIGGRQINVDPVFTVDEKFILLANRTTIHVYSTHTSLLTRSIKLKINTAVRPNAHIVTYCLSPTNSNLIWVACSDGTIYGIDWTTGAGADQSWSISSTGCIHMTVASMESGKRRRDVVFTTEMRKDGGWRITANELAQPKDPFETAARTIYTSNQRISFLKTANEGSVIVAASEKRVLIANLRSTEYNTIDKIRYEFRIFESPDLVSSLDLKVHARPNAESLGKSALRRLPVVDVVVGDARGSIFVHDDLLGNLARSQEEKHPPGISLIPRKLHWHRKEVCTVKWSLDGNYIISGGTETVLVLWQLDTGKKQFLPHMSTTIQNVVVSPSGTSYGIQLSDNSTMILSVTELEPTTNIAGIQTFVLDSEEVVGSRVRRVKEERDQRPFIQRTPAVISPVNPSRLLVGVSASQEISPSKPLVTSMPYLQTFDLGSGHNISRQALTRSNETNINATPSGHQISEPRVTHMKVSHDGNWLATVDEWTPPQRDVDFIGHQGKEMEDERRRRKEVYLKFWQWSRENDTWELVSRIDAPHSLSGISSGAGRVLDLAADPSSLRFSTIGEDKVVHTWTTKTRKRDGVVVRGNNGQALRNWDCHHAISIGKPELIDNLKYTQKYPGNGIATFSDDGSILAAACGDSSILHLLDPETGVIRLSRTGLFEGEIIKAEFLGQDLITLSNTLQVYDLVTDEVRYSIRLSPSVTSLSISQKTEMMHLAADRKNRTFAVALPATLQDMDPDSLLSKSSELAVFEQDKQEPVLEETFPTLITALLPALGSDGYLVLDSAADIRTVLRKGGQAVTAQAQSTSALQLDVVEERNGDLISLVENGDMDVDEEIDDALPSSRPPYDIDDDDETPVVKQQQLTAIFDIGPAFALPSIDDLFYQVASLFISPPLAHSVS